ncbi:eukaryotic translation initiation factor 5B [Bonamia ostreae]|uniref:Eukaryotic translation initiation factor 5B n=1 Tax=Bonamia ostreae TaxID=126728 RepID=A0ABV2ARB7_9EUKA
MTGEGIPDLLSLLVKLTQTRMASRLQLSGKVECSVLEVRQDEGLGHTIDVILSDGSLKLNDRIVLSGLCGPIDTTIRALYEPAPLKEIRFKGEFKSIGEAFAAAGVKICAQGLENAVAGSRLRVCGENDDIESLKQKAIADVSGILGKVDAAGKGVSLQSSTLGALEAFLEYLKSEKIPVCNIAVGPVRKKDVLAASVMLEKKPEYACILAFNVRVDREIEQFAEEVGVKIFKGEIIYNLKDFFLDYIADLKQKTKKEGKPVFPVIMSIIPEFVLMKHNPIILGCKVEAGKLLVGTPLAAIMDEKVFGNVNKNVFSKTILQNFKCTF